MYALWIACIGLTANVIAAVAQPFLITTTPQSITITEATATFKVTPSVQSGFKASLYLSAECPTLPRAGIDISPSVLNAPYDDSATVTVTLRGPKTGGTHNLFITARNGAVLVHDTVEITIPNRSAWTVFTYDELGQYWNLEKKIFALDRQNGVAWFGGGDSLTSYDGAVWNRYAWPDTTGTQPYYYRNYGARGMCIDSTGLLWLVMGKGVLQWDGNDWTIIGQVDSSAGLTASVFESINATTSSSPHIYAGLNGGVWMLGWGATGTELIRYDGTNWTHYTELNSDLGNSENRFIADALGNVWVQGYRNGITKFDGTYWTFYPSEFFGLTGVDKNILPLAATPDGSVWLRNRSYSITRFHADSAHGTPYNDFYSTFGHHTVSAIDIAPNGDIWAGLHPNNSDLERYPGGLVRFDGSTWWHYTIDNSGLPDNFITDVEVDNNNNVWIITGEGSLTVLDGSVPPNEVFTGNASSVHASDRTESVVTVEVIPNPVKGRSLIRLNLAAPEPVEIVMVNSLGQVIMTIVDEVRHEGDQFIPFDADEIAPGCYFFRTSVNGQVRSLPVMIVK